MDPIFAGTNAGSVCDIPPAMLPGLRSDTLRNYSNDGTLVEHGTEDTSLSGLGAKIYLSPFLPVSHQHLFLQDAV